MGSPTSPLTPRTYPRTLVIMPAWNEEEALPATIAELRRRCPTWIWWWSMTVPLTTPPL